jgi:hypothetical protein
MTKSKSEWFAEADLSHELAENVQGKEQVFANGGDHHRGPLGDPSLCKRERGPLGAEYGGTLSPQSNGYHNPNLTSNGTPYAGIKPARGLPTNGFDNNGVNSLRISRNSEGRVEIPNWITPMAGVRLRDLPTPRPREYVLEGLIPTGAATSIYGDGGVAKSMLAMSLCCAVANGDTRWMGREIDAYGAVFVDFELTADEQMRRATALAKGAGYDEIPEDLMYFCGLGHDPETVYWNVYKYAVDNGISLVVIDSFGLGMDGEASSDTDVKNFYRRFIEPFEELGMAVVLIDHQAKGGDSYAKKSSFGSVYKRNLVRSMIQLEALDQDEEYGTLDLIVRHGKHNFGALAKPFGARVLFGDGEIKVETVDVEPTQLVMEEGVKATDRVMMAFELIDEPITQKDIADQTAMPSAQVKSILRTLSSQGKVRTTGEKVRGSDVWETVPTGPVTYAPRPKNVTTMRPTSGARGSI